MKYFSQTRKGFTLIEVLMTLALVSSVSGFIIAGALQALKMRQKAISLNRAIYLCKQKMHEIKSLNKTDSGKGEYPSSPGYRFEYVIRDQELDLQKIADSLGAGKAVESSPAAKYFKERSGGAKSTTGIAFKMMHFHVSVQWAEKESYELDYYRGLGF